MPVHLCNKLANVQFDLSINDVQEYWTDSENKLITVVDEILPVRDHCNNAIIAPHCPFVKHKLNLRKRLLKNFRKRPTLDLKLRIKNLNIEIQNYFFSQKNKISENKSNLETLSPYGMQSMPQKLK